MYAIELETLIRQDGSIRLPEKFKDWYGQQARLIILRPETIEHKPQNSISQLPSMHLAQNLESFNCSKTQ